MHHGHHGHCPHTPVGGAVTFTLQVRKLRETQGLGLTLPWRWRGSRQPKCRRPGTRVIPRPGCSGCQTSPQTGKEAWSRTSRGQLVSRGRGQQAQHRTPGPGHSCPPSPLARGTTRLSYRQQGHGTGRKGSRGGQREDPRAAAYHTATSSASHCAPVGVRPQGPGLALWVKERRADG